MPPICLDAPFMFQCPHMCGHPLYVWMLPVCLDTPLYVWMPPYACTPPVCLDNVWMPNTYTIQRKHALSH